MADFIPNTDGDFQTWQANFITYANAHLAGLGILAGDMAPITAAQTTWNSAYTAHSAAQASAKSASQAKDAARLNFEIALRALVVRLQASPAVDNAERAALGITVRDTTKTAVSVPTTRPIAKVDTSQRLRHVIAFMNEATPTSKAKPAGVMGAEIWVKCGDPAPTDPSQCVFLALDTRTPYTADFPGTDAGKVAHYMLRWVNTRGEKGPWSETVSATIGA